MLVDYSQSGNLTDFKKPGVPDDAAKKSLMQYEEQRKLKLAMLSEYQNDLKKAEKDFKQDLSTYLDPRDAYLSKKSVLMS